ncbi:hypothetical protein TELCIR_10247 [Teladorsagia circumcincta]|uniref:Uncharacterized protein n=1 Tax=Teladorsagia circumcincta TaxID=45464 RepID=A0A2G9UCU1_TELCI|nr:hypothetical protein TELCIR_10247 [Teladorsagia circumcincta]
MRDADENLQETAIREAEEFEEAHTYGVTALMCIVTAMGVLQKMPPFDIAPLLPTSRLATMTPTQVMAEVCEYAGQPFVTLSKL